MLMLHDNEESVSDKLLDLLASRRFALFVILRQTRELF